MTSGKEKLNAINGARTLSHALTSDAIKDRVRSAISPGCRRSAQMRPPTPAAKMSRENNQACHQRISPPQANKIRDMKR
jgi:hypothetical protein